MGSEPVVGPNRYGFRYRNPKPVGRDYPYLPALNRDERARLNFVCDSIDTLARQLAELRFERDDILQRARRRVRKRIRKCTQ